MSIVRCNNCDTTVDLDYVEAYCDHNYEHWYCWECIQDNSWIYNQLNTEDKEYLKEYLE